MGVKVEGAISVQQMLLRLDSSGRRRVVAKLVEQGDLLRKLAIRMAPVDEANLEHAIHMSPEPGAGRLRDGAGRFLRSEVEVFIDMGAPVPQRPDKTVGDYAYEMHEHLSPMGPLNLGPKSILKQLGEPEVVVGGGFLERAADEVEQGLDQALRDVLSDLGDVL